MAIQIQLRQGTTTEHNSFTGAQGELTYNTTLKSLVLHDGVTAGGVKIPYLSNGYVPSTMLPTATESVVGASKIATTAIAKEGMNDTDIITAKKLRDVAGNAIKPRSWSNVTASRIADTWYTNTTGNDIGVFVSRSGVNIYASITVRKTGTSTELLLMGTPVGSKATDMSTGFWEVPDGFDYKISPFGEVMELRV